MWFRMLFFFLFAHYNALREQETRDNVLQKIILKCPPPFSHSVLCWGEGSCFATFEAKNICVFPTRYALFLDWRVIEHMSPNRIDYTVAGLFDFLISGYPLYTLENFTGKHETFIPAYCCGYCIVFVFHTQHASIPFRGIVLGEGETAGWRRQPAIVYMNGCYCHNEAPLFYIAQQCFALCVLSFPLCGFFVSVRGYFETPPAFASVSLCLNTTASLSSLCA
ncbi:hypothetical protein BX070DRAFT_142165 [Coemansia spiralis]|nr:hypothetical protein BX070DRAFT_142165 [Coemansia spiralis]